jgi:hypothetical protein
MLLNTAMAVFFSTVFFGKNCLTKMPLTPIFHFFFGLIRAYPWPYFRAFTVYRFSLFFSVYLLSSTKTNIHPPQITRSCLIDETVKNIDKWQKWQILKQRKREGEARGSSNRIYPSTSILAFNGPKIDGFYILILVST